MESYKNKYLTGKISKIDQQLNFLDTLVPNGIVKECLRDKMKLKKKSFNKKVTQNLKRQKIIPESKSEDQKVILQNNLYLL